MFYQQLPGIRYEMVSNNHSNNENGIESSQRLMKWKVSRLFVFCYTNDTTETLSQTVSYVPCVSKFLSLEEIVEDKSSDGGRRSGPTRLRTLLRESAVLLLVVFFSALHFSFISSFTFGGMNFQHCFAFSLMILSKVFPSINQQFLQNSSSFSEN